VSPRLVLRQERERQRARILDAFAERARRNGPRSVVMAELARELGISTRTLYQHFESKAEMVREVMERWARDVEVDQARRARSGLGPRERMIEAADSWIEGQDRFSGEFWTQVQEDYPEASRVLLDQVRKSLGAARAYLGPRVSPELDAELALSILRGAIARALDPKRCDRLGLSRQEAVRQAVDLWCRGAMAPKSD
jgi:AcrR family transcriptional regulator